MDPTAIVAVCSEIKGECDAIIGYIGDKTSNAEKSPDTSALFDHIMYDELEHVQELALHLTQLMGDPKTGTTDAEA